MATNRNMINKNRIGCFHHCIFGIIVLALWQNNTVHSMPFKYSDEIQKLEHCFIGFEEPNNKTAYRWVFDSNDSRNFSPVYAQSKSRYIEDIAKGRYTFRGWALSLYETKKQAKDKLLYYKRDKPQLLQKLGTHIAEGVLNIDDGLCDIKSSHDGHFSHFEYEDAELAPKFTIVDNVIS